MDPSFSPGVPIARAPALTVGEVLRACHAGARLDANGLDRYQN
ncbi:MAG TPA: hypothetical protein VHB21_06100 [Minicystis sp.]|nr:hypothetical protein [Minicystis sp.]